MSSAYEQRSFGFITVYGDDLAAKIMAATHVIDGHTVGTPEIAKPARADRDKARQTRGAIPDEALEGAMIELAATRKIFVGGLSHQTSEQALYVRVPHIERLLSTLTSAREA